MMVRIAAINGELMGIRKRKYMDKVKRTSCTKATTAPTPSEKLNRIPTYPRMARTDKTEAKIALLLCSDPMVAPISLMDSTKLSPG